MQIRVLGPVEVLTDGVDVRLGGRKQRTVLALLAAQAGKVVSVDALIDGVWGEQPTPGARSTLQTYVSNLRAAIGDLIVREHGGYRLAADPLQVDGFLFEQEVAQAGKLVEADPAGASQRLRAALAVWRGHPYGGVGDSLLLELEARRLEEVRLQAVEARMEAELALGHHAGLVPELEVLCEEFPLREGFRAQHMLALYRSGRQAEALRAYQKTRAYLAEELGLEPSPQLRRLEGQVLNQDVALLLETEPQVQTRAFLLTDIEDSTVLWELHTEAMRKAVAEHDRIVMGAVEAAGGRIVKRVGDGIDIAFADVGAAVAAAEEIQRGLAAAVWATPEQLVVRMAVDVGEVEARGGDYFGPVLNRAGRILASAHGGQVLLSADAHAALAAATSGWQAKALGEFRFKGIGSPQNVFQLLLDGLPADFPPLRIDRLPPPVPTGFGRSVRGYELREQAGSGDFGIVYRAYQPSVGREVAIKVIRPELVNRPSFIRRFEAEARLVAQLEHPHVVSLYDYWRDPEGAYLVMRWLRGGSLRQALERGPWNTEQAARLLAQVGSALSYAHRHGIVHRDLKPANVLLDEDGHAYLSDFGIAARLPDPDEPGRLVSASPAYVAPEEVAGEPHTFRSDLFGLGLLTFELLSGQRPPMDGALPSLSELRPELPPLLDGVIARATAPDPGARYESVDAFLAAFAEATGADAPSLAETYTPAENPYKGLRAFGETDAEDFHGRDSLVGELVAAVAEHRLVAVVGPSGIGKSSVVKAGLIPALRGRSQRLLVTDMFPGSYPFEELAAALLRVAVERPDELVEELARDELGIARMTKRILPPGSELVLVVDQFEELFTLTADEETRRRFLDGLTALVDDPRSAVRLVITLRADFLDHPLRYQEFGELLRAGMVAVTVPSDDELAEAIEGPSARVGARFEPGLVSQIIADVEDQPGALPLLQYALTELFAGRTSDLLTLEGYLTTGGVVGALGRRAEELYGRLDRQGRAAARQVFLRLVSVDPQAQDTRRRVRRRELRRLELEPTALEEILGRYGEHRLLTFDREPLTRSPTVEVAHEALLTQWERLRGWIDERREDLLLHHRLAQAVEEWEESGRRPDSLPREGRLAQFETWAGATDLALTAQEREFLAEARAASDAAARHRRRRRRAILAGFATLAAAASVAAVFAFILRGQAEDEARLSKTRQLAASARANLDVDPELTLLGIEAVETTRSHDGTVLREAEETLHDALAASRTILRVRGAGLDAAFSPDGRRLISAGAGTVAVIRDAETGKRLLTLRGHDDRVRTGRYSPDGRLIATASLDGTAKIWSAATGAELRTLRGHGAPVFSAQFNGDGSRLVTVGDDAKARVWDTRTWRELHAHAAWARTAVPFSQDQYGELASFDASGRLVVFEPFANFTGSLVAARVWDPSGSLIAEIAEARPPIVTDGDASPDGRLVAYAMQGGDVTLRRTSDGRLIAKEHVGGFLALDVEFSPDGTRLAASSTNGTAVLWEITPKGLRERMTLVGHAAPIVGIDFSSDGSRLLTVSNDGTARIWDISPLGGREVLALPGFERPDLEGGVEFSPDGKTLVAASGAKGTVRAWDAATGRQLLEVDAHARAGGEGNVFAIDFSPDGSRFATASYDGTARIFDSITGEQVAVLRHACPRSGRVLCWVLDVDFSADGSKLVTGSTDYSVRIFDVASRRQLRALRHESFVWTVELDSANSLLATAGSFDASIRLWDPETGRLVRTLRHEPSTDTAVAASFSPDGTRVASAGFSGKLRIWNPADGRKLVEVQTGLSQLYDVQFAPDGRRVATSSDEAISVWDAATGKELLRMRGRAWALSFSPDGTLLAWSTPPPDPVIRVVALEVERLLEIARDRVTRSLTDAECRQYLQRACPDGS